MLGNKGTKKFYRTGGTRGGLDQFKWDDVKSDKDRENYLGHSVLAPVGRWQKGKDLFWYTKNSSSNNSALDEEKRRIKELDDELINNQLGYKTKTSSAFETNLDSVEIKQYLSKGQTERMDNDVERVKGLGAAPAKFHDHIEKLSFVEKQIHRLKSGAEALALPPTSLPGSDPLGDGRGSNDKSSKKRKDRDGDDSESSKKKKHKKHKKKEHKRDH